MRLKFALRADDLQRLGAVLPKSLSSKVKIQIDILEFF